MELRHWAVSSIRSVTTDAFVYIIPQCHCLDSSSSSPKRPRCSPLPPRCEVPLRLSGASSRPSFPSSESLTLPTSHIISAGPVSSSPSFGRDASLLRGCRGRKWMESDSVVTVYGSDAVFAEALSDNNTTPDMRTLIPIKVATRT